LLGAILQDNRIVAAIPNPLFPRSATHIRVAVASQGWHVLFVEPLGDTSSTVGSDSANIWYGRFDGRRWYDLSRASIAFSAKLSADLSSALVTRGSELAFAYAFDQPVSREFSGRTKQGVVMLTRRSDTWSAETLHTAIGPNYVAMTALSRGPLRVGIVQAYFDASRRVHSSSLFEAAFDTSWGIPRLVADGGLTSIRRPTITGSNDVVLTWQVSGARPRVDWAALEETKDAALPPTTRVLSPNALDVKAVHLENLGVVWFAPDVGDSDRIAVLVRRGDSVQAAGVIRAPNTGLSLSVTALDTTIALLSAKVTLSTEVAPARSYLTQLAVSCHG
jgi:hypothetical protein